MSRLVFIYAACISLAYLGLCAVAFVFQRSLIYYPQPREGGGGATTMALPVDGARLLVTTRPHDGPHALVYFGGNAEDVSLSLPDLAGAFPDHAIFLLHYRGYGGSSGKPSESALFADALALFDLVSTRHPHILIVGRSLGSGVAVYVASRRAVGRLVLVTPYDSIQELAARQYPYLPVRWLLRDKFESWKYAAAVAAPTLVIAAEYDEVIPRSSTDSLVRHFRDGVASLQVIAGACHNTISERPEYLPLLKGSQ